MRPLLHAFALLAAAIGTQVLAAAPPAIPLQVRADSRIEVVYLTAPDCVYCKSWRHMRTGDWTRYSESPTGRDVKLVTVEKQTLRMPIEKRHYPAEYAQLHEKAPQFGNVVPAWWVVLDGVPVMRRVGEGRWREEVEPVLDQLVKAKQSGGALVKYTPPYRPLPAKLSDSPADVASVPYLGDGARKAYAEFLKRASPRAFALSADGAYGWRSGGDDPARKALENCGSRSEYPCKLYVVDDKVVFKP
jgi:hypothetical protein